jgi:hypothetical protein
MLKKKLRLFLRDKLGFKATDIGEGLLINNLPEADMGCHLQQFQVYIGI